ncbi:MAG: hypothetical protein GSR79_04975 [Desulfurococcales archaeon]|nr:hypothetical protein [Desulfurococcales archaeon]
MDNRRATTVIRNEALKLNAPLDPFGLIELYTLLKPLLGLDPVTAKRTRELEYMSALEYLVGSFKKLGVDDSENLASLLIDRILARCLDGCSDKGSW